MESGNTSEGSTLYKPAVKPELDPHHVHEQLMIKAPKALAFANRFDRDLTAERNSPIETTDVGDFDRWRSELLGALTTCLGERPPSVPTEPAWGETEERTGFNVRAVEFSVEPHHRAVGWLVTPPGAVARRPTVICLQGHSPGAHISLGDLRFPGDEDSIAEDRDYAVQAVRRGYNAFVLEQRAFGERMDSRPRESRRHYDYSDVFTDERCRHQAMVALLLGRTLVGERVHDVRCAVDILSERPEVDTERIAVMGNSGGGTVSLYAACVEPRIAAVMPSCSFCPYIDSIGRIDHCSDNYLPGALKQFDIPDLAGLIAPRPMVVVAGSADPIFPYLAIERGVALARRIYAAAGAPKALRMFTGPGGHRFYEDAWVQFGELTGWV